jgi:hypothetical protein
MFAGDKELPKELQQQLDTLKQHAAPYFYDGYQPSAAWDSDRGRMMLFRLLSVVPWGKGQPPDWRSGDDRPLGGPHTDAIWAYDPAPDASALQSALGAIMDGTVAKPNRLRPLARYWARWAAEQIRHLASAWVRAICPAAPCPLQTDHWGTVYEEEPSWRLSRQGLQRPPVDDMRSVDEASADSHATTDSESDYEGSTDSPDVTESSEDSEDGSDSPE